MSNVSLPFVARETDVAAFYKYAHDPVFRAFIQGLEGRGLMLLALSANAQGETMYRAQGRASELMDVTSAFKTFVENLGRPAPPAPAEGSMEGFS